MASPMELIILKLKEFGFFQFILPFMLTAAVFYGLLRRSKIFGEPERNVAVNATIAIAAAFLVWAYPILAGVNTEVYLSQFFFVGTVGLLVVMIGIMVFAMFLKRGVGEVLEEKFKGGSFFAILLGIGIVIGIAILVMSGLLNIFFPTGGPATGEADMSPLIYSIIFLIAIFGIIFFIAR